MVDGYLIVVRENYSDKYMLADCMRQVEFIEANVLGFVITDSSGGASYYKPKYRGRYNYHYKKYGYKKYGYGYKKYGYGYGYGYGSNKEKKDDDKQ